MHRHRPQGQRRIRAGVVREEETRRQDLRQLVMCKHVDQREWPVPDFPHRSPGHAPGTVRRSGPGDLRENGTRRRPRMLRCLPLAGSQLRCLPIHQSAREALSGRAERKNRKGQSPDGPGKEAAR